MSRCPCYHISAPFGCAEKCKYYPYEWECPVIPNDYLKRLNNKKNMGD